ncbi:MAG: acetyl-CoA hydrolase/transferase family protein [Saprospiraceae bacterium]|nr:acetyl-CoA hydrolase/transferase family protein [Saprospiraceae bacterium]
MQDYAATYLRKLITLDDIPDLLKSDTDVIVAQCASEPQGCMSRFHLAKERVHHVNVFSVLTLKAYDFYMDPTMKGHFELCSWFHAPGSRQAVKAGTGTVTYVPNMLHRAGLDRIQVRKPHLFIGTCTPPDDKGFVSLSLGITYEKDVLEAASIVILEVNDQLPRTFGDTQLHINDVDHFVEFSQTPPTLPIAEPDAISIQIGEHIARLVEDGATIQLGIGEIPNAAALSLRTKNDLGVHTEMLVDSMVELYEMGVITNKKKAIYKDKFVATFAMGSEKLYQWLDNNQAVEFLRGRYVNDPCVIRRNSKMTSINTCLMVDLTGQVASESIGTKQYSGTGGQTDTATGAIEGLDGQGKSIIACRSTAQDGTVSTITPVLPLGTAVTLHRSNTDWVVTEYGAVRLRGLTIRERAAALISIAHPDFRNELTTQAIEYGFI